MEAIAVQGLTKRFGDVTALEDVSVAFEQNKIYGLLGRNGAGKTTLLNAITGRLFPTAGGAALNGVPTLENDDALRQMYMLSEQTFYPETMRVDKAIEWSAAFYPAFDAAFARDLAARFALPLKSKVRALSTGYTTIFKLVIALSTNAPYLLLDEPVLGLDANHRDLFYKTLVAKYAEKPFCAVLSTHLVEEVSPLVEQVVIIHKGRILTQQSRDELLAQGYTVAGPAAAVDAYTAGKQLLGTDALGGLKTAYLLGARDANAPAGLEFSAMDLQRLFIQLTGDEERTVAQ